MHIVYTQHLLLLLVDLWERRHFRMGLWLGHWQAGRCNDDGDVVRVHAARLDDCGLREDAARVVSCWARS